MRGPFNLEGEVDLGLFTVRFYFYFLNSNVTSN